MIPKGGEGRVLPPDFRGMNCQMSKHSAYALADVLLYGGAVGFHQDEGLPQQHQRGDRQ